MNGRSPSPEYGSGMYECIVQEVAYLSGPEYADPPTETVLRQTCRHREIIQSQRVVRGMSFRCLSVNCVYIECQLCIQVRRVANSSGQESDGCL